MTQSTRSGAGRRPRTSDFDAREQLLDVAITLFAERGITNTTVAQIAAAGSVTSAMVHYWFQTRDRLLDAVVDERLAPLFREIWDSAGFTGRPLETVDGIVRRMLEVTGRHPWLPSLWLREIVNEGGQLRERALRHIPMDRIEVFGRNIAAGQRSGEINPDIEPLLLFNSILAVVMLPQATAKIWQRIHPGLAMDRTVLARHVAGLLMNGLAGHAALAAGGNAMADATTRSRRRGA
jgi:AcrR family transcriptional regulator